MKPSVKVSLIAAVVATMGIGGIAKMVSASSPNTSSMAVAQEKVKSRESSTDEASEIAKLQPLAKISASQARQIAEAAQGNKASNVQLENEDGNLIYAVNIGQNEVKVDSGNGRIVDREFLSSYGGGIYYRSIYYSSRSIERNPNSIIQLIARFHLKIH